MKVLKSLILFLVSANLFGVDFGSVSLSFKATEDQQEQAVELCNLVAPYFTQDSPEILQGIFTQAECVSGDLPVGSYGLVVNFEDEAASLNFKDDTGANLIQTSFPINLKGLSLLQDEAIAFQFYQAVGTSLPALFSLKAERVEELSDSGIHTKLLESLKLNFFVYTLSVQEKIFRPKIIYVAEYSENGFALQKRGDLGAEDNVLYLHSSKGKQALPAEIAKVFSITKDYEEEVPEEPEVLEEEMAEEEIEEPVQEIAEEVVEEEPPPKIENIRDLAKDLASGGYVGLRYGLPATTESGQLEGFSFYGLVYEQRGSLLKGVRFHYDYWPGFNYLNPDVDEKIKFKASRATFGYSWELGVKDYLKVLDSFYVVPKAGVWSASIENERGDDAGATFAFDNAFSLDLEGGVEASSFGYIARFWYGTTINLIKVDGDKNIRATRFGIDILFSLLDLTKDVNLGGMFFINQEDTVVKKDSTALDEPTISEFSYNFVSLGLGLAVSW